jgi:hypothetical protein
MKYKHLDKWTCASGKWMIPMHEWSPHYRIAHGWKISLWICHQCTWELMKQKDPRSIFIIILTFFLLFFSSHYNFFFYFSFFYFAPQNFLQHNTY